MKPPYPAPVTEWHNDTYDAISPKRPELSQDGRTIVITGAGSGIGREIAHAFAEAGAKSIHILGRTKSLLEETQALVEAKYLKAKVIVHVADILDAAALDQTARKIGSWDVLVANAGYIPKPELIETGDSDDWWKTFEVCFSLNHMLLQTLTLFLSDQHQRQLPSHSCVSPIQENRQYHRCELKRIRLFASRTPFPGKELGVLYIQAGNSSLLRVPRC
jgi:hypothetical protein